MEGIWALEERGVKAPSALGQRQQLEPVWEDLPPPTKMMGCCSLGHMGVPREPVQADVGREGSRPTHPSLSCLSSLRLLQLLGAPPPEANTRSSVLSGVPTRTSMERWSPRVTSTGQRQFQTQLPLDGSSSAAPALNRLEDATFPLAVSDLEIASPWAHHHSLLASLQYTSAISFIKFSPASTVWWWAICFLLGI